MSVTLENTKTGVEVLLPPELYWLDEFDFQRVKSENVRSLSGSFLVLQSIAKGGRPITLGAPDDMNWIARKDLRVLYQWADEIGLRIRVKFEYDSFQRTMLAVFNHADKPIEATPVRKYESPKETDEFNIKINLLEVEV